MPWIILRLWGFLCVRDTGRAQSYQNHWRSIASVQLQLLDFLYIVHSKKGTPFPCADPVRYIKKKNTNKGTIHCAMKILITIFCYGKGIVGSIFIALNSLRGCLLDTEASSLRFPLMALYLFTWYHHKCHAGASRPGVSSPRLSHRGENFTPVRDFATVSCKRETSTRSGGKSVCR